MKKIVLMLSFMLVSMMMYAQSHSGQAGKETQEQRLTRAQDKKTKGGKKNMTMEQKVKVAKKEDKKARKMKAPKPQNRPKPKM